MEIPNLIENKIDPTGFQTMINGRPVRITDLSRDDLIQVVCESMNALQTIETLQKALAGTLDNWTYGRLPETPLDIVSRLSDTEQDSPAA